LGCSIENDDFQDASGNKNKKDKDRPIEKWGNACKAKLAVFVKLKKEASPIHQVILTGKRQLCVPLQGCKMLTFLFRPH